MNPGNDKLTSGKLDTPPDADNILRSEEMRHYFDTIYGDMSGWLHLAVGFKPYINAKGKYQFGNWVPASFHWPDPEINAFIDFLLKESEEVDIYVCPYLMRENRRAKGMAVDHRWLHSDIDKEPFDSVKAEKLYSIGGFAIGSGTAGPCTRLCAAVGISSGRAARGVVYRAGQLPRWRRLQDQRQRRVAPAGHLQPQASGVRR